MDKFAIVSLIKQQVVYLIYLWLLCWVVGKTRKHNNDNAINPDPDKFLNFFLLKKKQYIICTAVWSSIHLG